MKSLGFIQKKNHRPANSVECGLEGDQRSGAESMEKRYKTLGRRSLRKVMGGVAKGK